MNADPHWVARRLGVLAPALSEGRRSRSRLVMGPDRCFSTVGSTVYAPWPIPGDDPAALVCGTALQGSPTKDTVLGLPLATFPHRLQLALALAEGRAALSWTLRRWPALAPDFERLAPGTTPDHRHWTAQDLYEEATSLVQSARRIAVPWIFGRFTVPRHPWERPWDRLRKVPAWESVAIQQQVSVYGLPISGDAATRVRRPPTGGSGQKSEEDESCLARVGIPYDEWDASTGQYRLGHVSVLEVRAIAPESAPAPPSPDILTWLRRSPTRAWQWGLEDGTDLDLDSYVDYRCRLRSGQFVTTQFHSTLRESPRDVASALLLDSTASLSANAGELMRLQLECADALAAGLAEMRQPHGVFAFSGNTRHRVEVRVLRDFYEQGRVALGPAGLRPEGYTRLGAALRHITQRILDVPTARRVVIALGDGLPSDEGYEGPYALADVKRAVDEAQEAGVLVYYLGVGEVSPDPLWSCFGPARSHRLKDVHDLPRLLGAIHEELCAR